MNEVYGHVAESVYEQRALLIPIEDIDDDRAIMKNLPYHKRNYQTLDLAKVSHVFNLVCITKKCKKERQTK